MSASAGTRNAPETSAAVRRRREGITALIGVQVVFGLFPLFVQFALGEDGFDARVLALWRMVFGALVLGGPLWLTRGRGALPRRRDLARFLVCALFGVVLNQVMALEGIARTTLVSAGLLMTLIPVFTYAIAIAARQELFRAGRALGITLALLGAGALLWMEREAGGPRAGAALLGNLLIIANCLSYALYLVLVRPLLERYSPLFVIGWVFMLSLVFAPFLPQGAELWPSTIGGLAWVGMAYSLVFSTALAYFLNTFALARVSASTTAAFIFLQPFVAGAAGVLVQKERVGAPAAVAAGLIFLGIRLVMRTPARRPRVRNAVPRGSKR